MFSKVALLSALAIGAIAQSTLTTDLFLPGTTAAGLSGSVVAKDATATTFVLAASDGSMATVTEGPNTYAAVYTTTIEGVGFDVKETCSLGGTTTASCLEIASASSGNINTAVTTSSTYSGSNIHNYPVTITAGVDKLTATGTSSNAAAATAAIGLSGLVLPGMAVLAGAMI